MNITEGNCRQQKRKISYQLFASFIPYFVDDSEEKNRDAYYSLHLQTNVFEKS